MQRTAKKSQRRNKQRRRYNKVTSEQRQVIVLGHLMRSEGFSLALALCSLAEYRGNGRCVQNVGGLGKNMIAGVMFLFVWLVGFLRPRQLLGYIAEGPKTERLTILRAATHEIELGDHGFCLSRSHYTDTYPAATLGIEPGTSSPGVGRSTD